MQDRCLLSSVCVVGGVCTNLKKKENFNTLNRYSISPL